MEQKQDFFQDVQAEPREQYTFQIDPESVTPVGKKYIAKLIKGMTVGILCGVFCIIYGLFGSNFLIGAGFAITLLMVALYLTSIFKTKKSYAAAKEKYAHCLFDYALYDDCLVIEINSDKGLTKVKCNLNEIVKAQIIGELVVLEIEGKLYLLKKNELIENSYFIERCKQNEGRETANKKVIRFALTFCLGWIGSLIINHTGLKPKGYTSRTGAYLLLSIVTGGIYAIVASVCNLAFNPAKPRNIGYKKDETNA